MDKSQWPVIVDGHRACVYCDQLERAEWTGVWPEQPWLCPMCRGRAMSDDRFAERVASQLYYQCMEIETPTTVEVVDRALAALQGRWSLLPDPKPAPAPAPTEAAAEEWDDDDRPF